MLLFSICFVVFHFLHVVVGEDKAVFYFFIDSLRIENFYGLLI